MAQETKRTKRLAESLPEGIAIGTWTDGRAKPFYVRFGADRDHRKVESFAAESDRNDRAEELAVERSKNGTAALEYDPREWREYRLFRARIGEGVTFDDLEEAWKSHRLFGIQDLPVGQAVEKYKKIREAKELSADTYRHQKIILERFVKFFPSRKLSEVRADDIRDWLLSLKEVNKFSPLTIRHHRKDVNTFFKRALIEKWARENPCAAVDLPKHKTGNNWSVLSLEDAFNFFKSNRDAINIGRLALEAFSGLRVSSAGRLEKNEISHGELGIELPDTKHKTGARHFIDGLPENVWPWIKHAPEKCWEIGESYHDHLKAVAFKVARVKNPGNVLRKTFCTYHFAAFKNPGLTASILTHRDLNMMYAHYKGRGMPEAQAKLYFSITPEATLGTFEDFSKSQPAIKYEPKPSSPVLAQDGRTPDAQSAARSA